MTNDIQTQGNIQPQFNFQCLLAVLMEVSGDRNQTNWVRTFYKAVLKEKQNSKANEVCKTDECSKEDEKYPLNAAHASKLMNSTSGVAKSIRYDLKDMNTGTMESVSVNLKEEKSLKNLTLLQQNKIKNILSKSIENDPSISNEAREFFKNVPTTFLYPNDFTDFIAAVAMLSFLKDRKSTDYSFIYNYFTDTEPDSPVVKSTSLFNAYNNPIEIVNCGLPFFTEFDVTLSDDQFLLPFKDGSPCVIPDDCTIPPSWNKCREFLKKYSAEIISSCKNVSANLQKRSDGTLENTRIVGVTQSPHKPGTLKLELYKTDYLTHRAVEQVLIQKNIYLSKADTENVEAAYQRTSLGVNIIVRLPSENKILLAKRGDLAAYQNAGKFYPSVVETFDIEHNDFTGPENPIMKCIMRGMEEELGIPDLSKNPVSKMYDAKNILVRSLFFTKKYRQDNVFSIVTLNDSVTLDDLIFCTRSGACDFALEIKNIELVEDTPASIKAFISENADKLIAQTKYCLEDYLWLRTEKQI